MSRGSPWAAIAAVALCACGKSAPRVESAASAPSVQNATISIGVTGSGSVLLSGQSAPCIASCRYSVPLHAVVALTSAAGPGAGFAGWTGACSGGGDCRFVAEADAAVGALFRTVEVPPAAIGLSIAIAGNGTVRVWDARGEQLAVESLYEEE